MRAPRLYRRSLRAHDAGNLRRENSAGQLQGVDNRGATMEAAFTDFDATLRDGRGVRVRAMGDSDDAEILQAFGRLGADARYMRFMRQVREVDEDRLRKTLASFPEHGFGIVATVPAADGYDIVGSAILVVGNNPTTCEFAITILPEYGGAGLGRILLSELISTAKRRGLGEMEGFVLAVNRPMLKLASRLGFSIVPDPDDGSVRNCRLSLG
jgi:RimJ/RimL family protein N-acetyltransferase